MQKTNLKTFTDRWLFYMFNDFPKRKIDPKPNLVKDFFNLLKHICYFAKNNQNLVENVFQIILKARNNSSISEYYFMMFHLCKHINFMKKTNSFSGR